MTNAFVTKLSGYAPLSEDDATALAELSRHGRQYPAGYDLILEGDAPGPVFVVLDGWACRYKILPGGTRQIISFLMPGDFCDMHVAVLGEMDHSIATLTAATVTTIPRHEMEALSEGRPSLVKAFWWTQLVDEGILRATIVSMGRRTSLERVAHLICELSLRMLNVGIVTDEHCVMPFSQIVLADAVGLTPVHVNRVVGVLRKAGALKTSAGRMIVADLGRMATIAGFDENYLHRRQRHGASMRDRHPASARVAVAY